MENALVSAGNCDVCTNFAVCADGSKNVLVQGQVHMSEDLSGYMRAMVALVAVTHLS